MAAPRGRFPKATDLEPALRLLEEHGLLSARYEKTSASILFTSYADADSSCLGFLLVEFLRGRAVDDW